jgi:hypothetical protein
MIAVWLRCEPRHGTRMDDAEWIENARLERQFPDQFVARMLGGS